MSLLLKVFAGLAITTALSSTVSAQGLVTQKNISLAMAQTIAQAALAQCQGFGRRGGQGRIDDRHAPR